MTCKDIFNGSTGNRATILILEAGEPKTGVAYNAAGLSIAYKIDTGSEVVITLTSGNWHEIGGGKYLVDVADSVYLAANLGKLIQFYGSLTDAAVYGEQHRVVANNPLVTIASSVWNAVLTGATFNVAGSAGRRLRTLADTVVLAEGDVISADNSGTINGENGLGRVQFASDVGTVCVNQAVRVSGQVRYIEAYNQPTQTATVDSPWCVIPTIGDEYTIFSQRNGLGMRIASAASGTIAYAIATIWRLIEDVGGPRLNAKAVELVTEDIAEVDTAVDGVKDDTENILTGINSLNNNHRGEFF